MTRKQVFIECTREQEMDTFNVDFTRCPLGLVMGLTSL